ncbi:hypothetical protein N7452_008502 [Penicillium brevicompactum]|uniref:Uncharacterized protein n=1 Tax=Penicillium brevicompactum TaxID=5074 RepID=A0A9W9U969_PENBR|nr:hypothetical protein N7452_008502 [Penicillium brevicompactum]
MPSIFAWLRRVYSLDTLDTRFTSTAITPNADTRRPAKDARANAIAQGASPSLWRTPEFFIYYVFFIVLVPLMFKTVVDASKVRRAYQWYMNHSKTETRPSTHTVVGAGEAQLEQRMRFDVWVGLVFITVLHGVSALKVLFIIYINFRIGKDVPRPYVPAATWGFNICILFANELCGGYPLEKAVKFLVPGSGSTVEEASGLVQWAQIVDDLGGLMPRWEVLFKVTVLRLISFNMDNYWSVDYPAASPIEVSDIQGTLYLDRTARLTEFHKKKQLDPASLSDRDRVKIPAEPAAFTLRNYIAYVLYSPLYLAGPILTFNDYVSQQRYTAASVSRARTVMYGIRFGLTLLCMELILHYIYAVAISKADPDWSVFTPGQLSMLAFFNLHIIWLKLLIPWRFFRLWALVDGIDPPENMVRCMSNNYSAFAFWRGWHRSYNRWIVRYIYVPLGGGGGGQRSPGAPKPASPPKSSFMNKFMQIRNFLMVFTFVALWHDINLRLLISAGGMFFPAHRWRSRPTTYRVLCGIGSVGNVLMMMVANLVGFALGLDGLKDLLASLTGSYSGLAYMVSCCVVLFVGVQVMFEVREDELRAGINLKC